MAILLKIRILALAAVLVLILVMLAGCSRNNKSEKGNSEPKAEESHDSGEKSSEQEKEDKIEELLKPEEKNYGRNTVSFSDMLYERPNISAMETQAGEITKAIAKEEIGADELLQKIASLRKNLNTLSTMESFAELMVSKDSSLTFFSDELTALHDEEISLNTQLSKMMAAFDASSYASSLSDNDDLQWLKKFHSDSTNSILAELRKEENTLLIEFHALSKSTVTLTFQKESDTCENLLQKYGELYGKNSSQYASVSTLILNQYTSVVAEKKFEIYVKLLQVRKKIADAYGADSYAEIAYADADSDSYHNYSQKQLNSLLTDIADILLPVYHQLDNLIFTPYFSTSAPSTGTLSAIELMNRIYREAEATDSDFFNVYCYLLQYDLFDVEQKSDNRSEENATFYLEDYEAPYLFLNTDGSYADYVHFAEQFGSFLDYYINGNTHISSDYRVTLESALGFLAMEKTEDMIPADAFTYLKYQTMCNALQSILENALFARFEESVYALAYDQITDEKVKELFAEAAEEFGFSTMTGEDLPYVLNATLIETPFAAQSIAIGKLCALEFALSDEDSFSDKLNTYKAFITRNGQTKSLFDALKECSLSSPFDTDFLHNLVDNVHFYLAGYRFYQTQKDSPNAS